MPATLEQRLAQSISIRRIVVPLILAAIRLASTFSMVRMPIAVAIALDAVVFATGWWAVTPVRAAYGQDLQSRANPWGLLHLPSAIGAALLLRDILLVR